MATGTALEIKDLRSYMDGDSRSRVNKIREKIESGSPFEMLDLNKTILDETKILKFKNDDIKSFFEKDSAENINLIGGFTKKSITLFKSGNKEFLLKQLYKSPTEFGGGKGSGGGAADTAINESLQCFYASILFNTPGVETLTVKKGKNNCTQKAVKAQSKYCHTQASASGTKYTSGNFVQELWKKAPKDWIEVDYTLDPPTNVYMRIAQTLYDSTQAVPLKGNKKVHFHRGSDFMSAIYAARKRCWDAQKTMKAGAVTAPASGFQNDKWNPGDIWISNLDPDPKKKTSNPLCFADKEKSRCQTWMDLKDHVLMDAKGKRGVDHTQGAILGVSLKKVGANPKVHEFNAGEVKDDGTVEHTRVKNKKAIFDGFVFGQTGNFFSSADCYFHFGGEATSTMQLRSTATTTSWQGEIKGGHAGGGKIGGGGINYFCETILEQSVTSGKAIKGVGDWNEFRGKPSLDAIYKLYKEYNEKQMDHFGNVTFKPTKKGEEDIVEAKITPIVTIRKDKVKTNNPYTRLSDDFMPVETKTHIAYVINTDKSTNETAKRGYVSKGDFKILADNYTSKGHNSAPAFYFSKYMCLLLLDAMYTSPKWNRKKNEFATKIVRYAMSNIDVSTYFIKIL